jgi:DNA-binding transcriptional LysR family regulator
MELRHLRYFVAIADAGGVHPAAAALHITQPALSRQLKDLEEELGLELFRRSSRGLRLTAAGHAFLLDARSLLDGARAAADRARRVAHGEEGGLRVGFIDSAAWEGIVPVSFQAFRATHSRLRLEAVPMPSGRQLEAIEGGAIDGGFLYDFGPPAAALGSVNVGKDKVVLVVPQQSALPGSARTLRLADLAQLEFVWNSGASQQYTSRLVACCERAGLVPRIVQEAGSELSTLSLVSAGIGVAFVNDAHVRRPPALVRFLLVSDLKMDLPLHFRYRRDASNPALWRFLETLRSQLKPARPAG